MKVIIIFIAVWTSLAHANSAKTQLKEILNSYLSKQTISCRFEHQQIRSSFNITSSKGHFYYKKPRAIRWEYKQPQPLLIVGDGTSLQIYDGDLDQVVIQDYTIEALGPTAILTIGSGKFDDYVTHAIRTDSKEGIHFALSLSAGELDHEDINLFFNQQGLLYSISWQDITNSTHTITFSNIKINRRLSKNLFVLAKGPDTEIIDQRKGSH